MYFLLFYFILNEGFFLLLKQFCCFIVNHIEKLKYIFTNLNKITVEAVVGFDWDRRIVVVDVQMKGKPDNL